MNTVWSLIIYVAAASGGTDAHVADSGMTLADCWQGMAQAQRTAQALGGEAVCERDDTATLAALLESLK